ncbi:hypothetical protein K2X30_02625 [bacterium]|jgi:Flp pilus assembly pilin Flp|nr:hypothetical protein [bacterium]
MTFQNIRNQKGQGLTEYVILLLLISVVSIAAVRGLGSTIRVKIREVKNEIKREVVNRPRADLDSGEED